jgi:hypothetical protein
MACLDVARAGAWWDQLADLPPLAKQADSAAAAENFLPSLADDPPRRPAHWSRRAG